MILLDFTNNKSLSSFLHSAYGVEYDPPIEYEDFFNYRTMMALLVDYSLSENGKFILGYFYEKIKNAIKRY